jgi:hypothetical protein
MRVAVYYNLHRRLFSVKALEGPNKGRVIAHRESVALTDVTFKVREAGRQRVIREGRKNVHAFVIGTLASEAVGGWRGVWCAVTYNPYRFDSFVDADPFGTHRPVRSASAVLLRDRRITAFNPRGD